MEIKKISSEDSKENFLLNREEKVLDFQLDEIDEYIVTLKNKDDLDSFYEDLETPGGTEFVPDRCVECCLRRSISRNTHYHLTQDEVKRLLRDKRVLSIIPRKLKDLVIKYPKGWVENSSKWFKSSTVVNDHKNWGLLRTIEGSQRTDWGVDGTTSVSGIVTATSSGKNVDVVIVDGFINPNHPEMAKNQDGTGGTRVVQFNWYSLNQTVGHGSNGTYTYPTTFVTNGNESAYGYNHGQHVAGTVAGNSQGWARDANIYNLYIYDSSDGASFWLDYIRGFHENKSINPVTGMRNPTIINNSWGGSYQLLRTNITSITWRGSVYNKPSSGWTDSQLQSFGIVNFDASNVYPESWYEDDLADMQDAMDSGVIIVGAAGNESTKIDVPGGQDYDNKITYSNGTQFFYHRGSANSSALNAICVGCVGELKNDSKANFSNCGPRIDVYAPGSRIISSVHASSYNDYRNSSYKVDKYSGTSMASPQVCGLLACALEQYPRMKQTDAASYIKTIAKNNQVYSTQGTTLFGISYSDTGISGICSATGKLSGTESFVPAPNKSLRITTTSTTGSISAITQSFGGAVGVASTTPNYGSPTFGFNDDGFWQLDLPFVISFGGVNYLTIYVSTNNYVTFGGKPTNTYDGDLGWDYNTATPNIPKIQISTKDASAQRIWTQTSGTAPNRTYRLRFEGHTSYLNGVLGSPTIVWEMIFYENAPSQIDLHMGVNPRVTLYNEYSDLYSLQGSANKYLYYRLDRPLSGTIQPRVSEKERKSTGLLWPRTGTLKYSK